MKLERFCMISYRHHVKWGQVKERILFNLMNVEANVSVARLPLKLWRFLLFSVNLFINLEAEKFELYNMLPVKLFPKSQIAGGTPVGVFWFFLPTNIAIRIPLLHRTTTSFPATIFSSRTCPEFFHMPHTASAHNHSLPCIDNSTPLFTLDLTRTTAFRIIERTYSNRSCFLSTVKDTEGLVH